MFTHTTDTLGQPQVSVVATSADWNKFLGRDTGAASPPFLRAGQQLTARDGIFGQAVFVLAFGLAALTLGEAVVIRSDYSVVRAVAGSRGVVGVSMSANTSATELSWYCIQGSVPLKVTAGAAANLPLYLTATAGSPSVTVVATDQIVGGFSATAVSATVSTKTVNTSTAGDAKQLGVPNLDGLYVGMLVTGTGIAASSEITAIGEGGLMLGAQSPAAGFVTLNNSMTATAAVTGTFLHKSTFLTALLQRPVAAGLG